DPPQEPQAFPLRKRRPGGRNLLLERLLAGDRAVLRGRPLAEAEARARMLARADGGALERARQVGAGVGDVGGALLEREQGVEARDAVRLRGRHGEPARGVPEGALAHPADALLRRAQRGEEEVALRPVGARDAVAVRIGGGPEHAVDRVALGRRRRRVEQVQVHYESASTRIAVALNSAVPERGSVASIVSTFVSTSSGKWRFRNASPGRSVASTATGASTEPRREVTTARPPSTSPKRAPSSGETRSASPPTCSGELNPLVWTPVLNDSSRRPVVRRSGNSASSSSTGGECSTAVNGAGSSTTSSHSRPCRNWSPGWSSSQHGHWMPPSASRRAYVMPACMGERLRSSLHTSSAWGLPRSAPSRRPSS